MSNLVVARLSPTGTVDLRVSSGVTVDLLADVLGTVVAGDPSADGGLVTAAPKRILDTRDGSPVEPGAAFPLYTAVPYGSAAAVVNVTVVGATGDGFLTVSAPGTGTPKVSQLSYARGSTVAAQVLAPVDAGGWVRLTVAPSSRVHLVVDLAGWVLGPQDAASVPRPSPPHRLVERLGRHAEVDGAERDQRRLRRAPTRRRHRSGLALRGGGHRRTVHGLVHGHARRARRHLLVCRVRKRPLRQPLGGGVPHGDDPGPGVGRSRPPPGTPGLTRSGVVPDRDLVHGR